MPLSTTAPMDRSQSLRMYAVLVKDGTVRRQIFDSHTNPGNVEFRFNSLIDSAFGPGFGPALLDANDKTKATQKVNLDIRAALRKMVEAGKLLDYTNEVFADSYTPCDFPNNADIKLYLDA